MPLESFVKVHFTFSLALPSTPNKMMILRYITPPPVPGPSLEGERGEQWLPQVFGTYLIEFQKFDLSVDPY